MNKNASDARGSFDSIRRAKEDERIEKKDRIRIFIEDALKHAEIYVNGDKANIAAKEPANRINEALGKLVAMQYSKLTYMETAPELSDIAAVFNGSDGQLSFLGTSDSTPNKLALEEVIQVITLNNTRHRKHVFLYLFTEDHAKMERSVDGKQCRRYRLKETRRFL